MPEATVGPVSINVDKETRGQRIKRQAIVVAVSSSLVVGVAAVYYLGFRYGRVYAENLKVGDWAEEQLKAMIPESAGERAVEAGLRAMAPDE